MSKEEFNDFVSFVTLKKHLSISDIFNQRDDEFGIDVWVAGDDDDVEGRFLNWYTNQPMSYLPWGENRPFKGSKTYNFIQAYIVAIQNGTDTVIKTANIYDKEVDHIAVPVCTVRSKVIKIRLRDLCSDFSFN